MDIYNIVELPLSKDEIIKKIKKISFEQMKADYIKLTKLSFPISNELRTGNKFVDYFTFSIRLETIGRLGMTYWDFILNGDYLSRPYIKRLIEYQTNKNVETYTGLYSIYKLHAGSCGLFKPCRMRELIHYFNVKKVIDPFAGWGCRMVGCASSNIESYTGIDTNCLLVEPYNKMIDTLHSFGCKTEMKLIIDNCLNIDFSKYIYDSIICSPPYYNLELYPNSNKMSKPEWNELYRTVFRNAFKNLLVEGWLIINILTVIYENVLVDLLGEADVILPLKKKCKKNVIANEAIFAWKRCTTLPLNIY